MIDDIDIYRAAKLLVDRHGAEAREHASSRITSMEGSGDDVGAAAWRQIAAAIEVLLTDTHEGPLN